MSLSMSRKFMAALSGTYNVHANEMAHGGSAGNVQQVSGSGAGAGGTGAGGPTGGGSLLPAAFAKLVRQQTVQSSPPPQIETIKCVVHFLDDTQHIFEVDRTAKGEELLDLVFRHLELIEREYFALQFSEMLHHHHYGSNSFLNGNGTSTSPSSSSSSSSTTVYNRWLDPSKKIRKQMRFTNSPFLLHFRVKFYVSDVNRLFEEYTRYHFYLQLRKDILAGRLSGEDSTVALLASYVLQSELGDYNEEDHKPGYASQFRYVPNQSAQFECKVESLHRLHQGQTPADAEINYLDLAKNLELYGMDLHSAKDCEHHDIQVGVSANGLIIYKQSIKVNTFSWAKIVKISFKRRFFFVQTKHEGTERFDSMIGFNLCSYRACKSLWKACVEQHTFFRLHTPKPLTKKFFFFFSLGSKFRYSGKTEFQTIEENKKRLTRTERIFIRNNVRHATMPATSPTKMNDAQKHLANLRLTSNEKPQPPVRKSSVDELGSNGKHHQNGSISSSSSGSFCSQPPTPPPPSLNTSVGGANSSHKSNLTLNSSSNSTSVLTAIKKQPSGQQMPVPLRKSSLLSQNTESNSSRSSSLSSASSHHHKIGDTKESQTSKQQQPTTSDLLSTSTSCDNIQGYHRNHMVNGRGSAVGAGVSSVSSHINGINDRDIRAKHQLVEDNHGGDNRAGHQSTTSASSFNIKSGSKVGSLPTSFTTINTSTPTVAYSPSTMISMPYIDQDKVTSIVSSTKQTTTITTTITSSVDEEDSTSVAQSSSTTEYEATVDAAIATEEQQYRRQVEKEIDSPIRELIKELYDVAATETAKSVPVVDDSPEESTSSSPVHLVTVSMKPDTEGRFGFNVKGGFDQNCPVLVSRVAPNTPADNAYPTKLHEGDQVISINGVEVSGLNHEEVVQLIRSTKDNGPEAELVLSIRPNVFHHQCDDDSIEEPPFQYTATDEAATGKEDASTSNTSKRISMEPINSLLNISMNLLQEGLESDLLISQFEQLHRRNEKETISIARYMENIPKNRYLDIAPYDSTRVVLNECITGDYINASYVTMTVETSGITNRYIASQGPLKRTTSDFWQMVWEQRCSVIVMVTPLVEDGRKKCFKYWPDDNQTMLVNDRLELTLESCFDEVAFLERKFKLTDTETNESHYISHLQYLAWPDQGVPDDDADFLKLIVKVRQLRQSSPDAHIVVHCSAGIGRTGVLILMETGICLIEANQPIYPLDLVRTMRTQRAMLIQTTMQFRFVCEALHRVFKDEVVAPLPQYLPPSDTCTSVSVTTTKPTTTTATTSSSTNKQDEHS